MENISLPGWYGKVASLGDFASRRLPTSFINPWDAWLQQVMHQSRAELGDAWREAYLRSPIWHFALLPPLCGEEVWAGVMMASVDKVGRYFPLAIAAALDALPADEASIHALADWLDKLETLALNTLDSAHSSQQFDDALLHAPSPTSMQATASGVDDVVRQLNANVSGVVTLPDDDALAAVLVGAAGKLFTQSLRAKSLWWAPSGAVSAMPLVVCPGLPDAAQFSAMLSPRG